MEDAKVKDVTPPVNTGESVEARQNSCPADLMPSRKPVCTFSRGLKIEITPFAEGTSRGLQLSQGRTAPFAEGTRLQLQWAKDIDIKKGFDLNIQGAVSQGKSNFAVDGLGLTVIDQPKHSGSCFPGESVSDVFDGFGLGPVYQEQSIPAPNDIDTEKGQYITFAHTEKGQYIRFAPNDIDIEKGQYIRFAPNDIDTEKGFAPNDIDTEKGFPPNDIDTEKGGIHSLGRVHGRLANMADSLFGLNIQGAVSLGGYLTLTGNGSSSPKEVFYLVVFLYVLGFLAALGGKLFCSPKMGVIGSVATVVAFLINMGLLIIYKI